MVCGGMDCIASKIVILVYFVVLNKPVMVFANCTLQQLCKAKTLVDCKEQMKSKHGPVLLMPLTKSAR